MKKLILCFVLFSLYFSPSLQAQERNHELGIRLSGLQDFDFIYKKSDNGTKFKRYRLAVANVGAFMAEINDLRFDMAYAQGVEKRRNIGKKVQFIHGWEPGFYVSLNAIGDDFGGNAGIFLGYVLGFQYNVSDNFYLNVETIPSLTVGGVFKDSDDDSGLLVNAGFNSNAVALTLAYTFTAPKK
jgi:hypothetical protein